MDNGYRFLEPRPGSNYRQPFVKGRRIRAEVLFRETLGDGARTAEELARDFRLPVDAVREAIDFCQRHPDVLKEDFDREEANLAADVGARRSAQTLQEQ
jgi:uncharacterized protein (DUF433 family)